MVQPIVMQIKGYNGEAVKILMDWIKGYQVLLSSSKDFTILGEMLLLTDFYDIPRHAWLLRT